MFESTELLKMYEAGVISKEELLHMENMRTMMKEQEILKQHNHPVTELSNKRWFTCVDDSSRNRGIREIKRSTREKVIEELARYYEAKNNHENLRLCDIFEEWLSYKVKRKHNKPETIKQNRASYTKYVKGKSIDLMKLKSISASDIEDWAIDTLTAFPMSAKAFNTNKIVLQGPLVYAFAKKHYIASNPWNSDEIDYKHLLNSRRIKPSKEMIFYEQEIAELLELFEVSYAKNRNIANLALKMNFDLGLRSGEICALKWKDVDWDSRHIFIQRMEDTTCEVVDFVKSDSSAGYRELFLTDNVIDILNRVKNDCKVMSEYIFCDEKGKRMATINFERRLIRAEKTLNWVTRKSTHCIRRTVASQALLRGLSLEDVRKNLGHNDSATTLIYIYSTVEPKELEKKIQENSILSNLDKSSKVSVSVCKKTS